jgi:uncharacterized protein (TIRG00374 family)
MLSWLDTSSMSRYLVRADPTLVSLTLVAVLADRALMAARWMKLVEALDVETSRARIVKIFFLSTFFGSFLPSGVGGEAVRAASFTKLTQKGTEAVASVVMDRFLGLLSMLVTGLVSLVAFYHLFAHPTLLVAVLVGVCSLVAALALALSRSVHDRARSRFAGREGRLFHWIERGLEALGQYRARLGVLLGVLLLSVMVQLLRVLQAYLLSEALGLETDAIYFLCFVPLILIVTMLPISVGGLGTANAAYVAFFSPVGMSSEGAFVLSVLILALGVFGNLPGGLIYAWEGFAAAAGPEEE